MDTMNIFKKAKLQPNDICEYNNSCLIDCEGRNHNWQHEYSCRLRRELLWSVGYSLQW